MIGTFKKLSYERKLGWYFSLLTSLVDKYFQIRVSNKVNWRRHLKGVFSQRELWLPLSWLHAKCLQSVWMIHKYWNSYKNVLIILKRFFHYVMAEIVPAVQLVTHAKSSTWYGCPYGHKSKFFRLDGLLLFRVLMGLRCSRCKLKVCYRCFMANVFTNKNVYS